MSNKKDLGEYTEEELRAELAKRRGKEVAKLGGYAAEMATEAASRLDAYEAYDAYLREREAGQTVDRKACPRCGAPTRVRRKFVVRTVRSAGGEHRIARHYHYCEGCRGGFYPLDTELQLPEEGELTSLLEQRVLDLGLHSPFEEAAERFAVHHGGGISENLVRRVIARVGQYAEHDSDLAARLRPPPSEVADVVTVQMDGSMLSTRGADPWREVKVGMVYRDEHHIRGGARRRGMVTEARFVARLGDFDAFRQAITEAAVLEGAWEARVFVVVGDGAPWIWKLAEEIHPDVVKVLDYPHAVEHAADAAKVLFPQHPELIKLWQQAVERMLSTGHVDDLIHQLEVCAFECKGDKRAALVKLIRYYEANALRMRYDRYRRLGLPCGSGAIESAHRHVLQKRMKLAGQHWDPLRANRLAQLRAALATCGPRNLYPTIYAQRVAS